ncbi:MAG TPA: tRNA (adenosine(37)-N6)-threonylcarbamoyltransferase complex ATPase subunit type 1 TsaE [Pyrinomonadaceae bacterium]
MTAQTAEDTFRLGWKIGTRLSGGELVLLTGGLGAGKTVVTKGIMSAMDYDPGDVTSPSFTLVNLYRARLDVYHIDLWRLDERANASAAVGLDDILTDETAVVIIEWADHLGRPDLAAKAITIDIIGDGDEPRVISVSAKEDLSRLGVGQ